MAVGAGAGAASSRRCRCRAGTAAARDLLPYGGPAALATVAWTGFRNGDYAIIGAVLGPAQAGFYWRAYQLAVEYQSKISACR